MDVEVWVIPPKKQVLVTELPGPPIEICGYISKEAKRVAEKRGRATVSEIGFSEDLFLGAYNLPALGGWGEAKDVAEAKAEELGYVVKYQTLEDSYDEDGDPDLEYGDDEDAWDPDGEGDF